MLTRFLLLLAAVLASLQAHALEPAVAQALAAGDTDARIEALAKATANPDEKTVALIQALADDAVKIKAGDKTVQVWLVRDGKGIDPATGAESAVPDDAEDVINNNRMRAELDAALAGLKLLSPDEKLRREALKTLEAETDEARLPLIEKALAAESVSSLKEQLTLVRARILLGSADRAKRLEAARLLGDSHNASTKTVLVERLKDETDPEVKGVIQVSLQKIEASLVWSDRLGALFSGISLGSILLLVALGLAITYGLMGVINMAHGELMMIGAYATFAVQNVFRAHFPGAFDWYILLAVPASFLAAALVGAVLERSVFRFLYGRPLETLLASWGLSLILMQAVRTVFGAQNVQVENPSWMSGGFDVLSNLTLPYNRLVIIAFAVAVLVGMTLLINKTRMGLFVRSVTQNRPMASCMGVNTARVDTMAFSLGAGTALSFRSWPRLAPRIPVSIFRKPSSAMSLKTSRRPAGSWKALSTSSSSAAPSSPICPSSGSTSCSND